MLKTKNLFLRKEKNLIFFATNLAKKIKNSPNLQTLKTAYLQRNSLK